MTTHHDSPILRAARQSYTPDDAAERSGVAGHPLGAIIGRVLDELTRRDPQWRRNRLAQPAQHFVEPAND